MSSIEIKIPDGLDESTLHKLVDVQKHFTEAEIVEIVKRYINLRFMQKKNRRVLLEKEKELKRWAREQGKWGGKTTTQPTQAEVDAALLAEMAEKEGEL